MTAKKEYFRKVLDLCDELDSIKKRIDRRSGRMRTRGAMALVTEKHDKLREIELQLDRAFLRGTLGEVRTKYNLGTEELVVIAVLLSWRVRTGNAGVPGREILSILFDSAYDMIAGMGILGPDGPLRTAGIVVAPEPYRDDVLEASFRLSDDMFYAIVYEIAGQSSIAVPRPPTKPLAGAREHLIETGRLAALYRKRAAALFPLEAEDFFTAAADVTFDETDYRIESGWSDLDARLLLTPEYEKYPLVRLERKYALSREEIIVVVTLFFAELISPAPYLVVSDLVKIVSRDDEDLMARRQILSPDSTLVKSGIVQLDEEYGVHRKSSTFDAYLADWVVEELIGAKPDTGGITPDFQIDLHEFLKGSASEGERK
jgi:hypothetical protein